MTTEREQLAAELKGATAPQREDKRAARWWADYRRRAVSDLGVPADVIERANNDDAEAQACVTAALDRSPEFVAHAGDFMARTEEALVLATSGGDWTLREARTRTLRAMVRQIAGPAPTALEAQLAHCVAMSLVEADNLATEALRHGSTDRLDRRRTRAHARAMSAARTLATVRRLALPVVQVNLAQQQVVAGTITRK